MFTLPGLNPGMDRRYPSSRISQLYIDAMQCSAKGEKLVPSSTRIDPRIKEKGKNGHRKSQKIDEVSVVISSRNRRGNPYQMYTLEQELTCAEMGICAWTGVPPLTLTKALRQLEQAVLPKTKSPLI